MHGLQSFLCGAEFMGGTCTGSNGGAIALLCAEVYTRGFGAKESFSQNFPSLTGNGL